MLPPGSAEPGPYRSSRTPYVIPIGNACTDHRYRRAGVVMGTQMGKTAGLFNVIGQKLDDDPAPILYFGPTRSNIDKVIEPQVVNLLRESPTLWAKLDKRGKPNKHVKKVSGVTLRLAWAGSPTELASQPAQLALADEVDKMKPVPGEGDPLALAEARVATYADGRLVATSSPTEGSVDVAKHPATGIEHWQLADADDISSPIWRFWQEGTRYEWAVPCPHCAAFFVPRFKLLTWPEGSTPRRAEREARLACSACGALTGNEQKEAMNARGTFLAPGQKVEGFDLKRKGPPRHAWLRVEGANGEVTGDPPDADTVTFWVSGLMSPWVTFGQRASAWLKAVRSGDQELIRAVLNTAFGELYRTRGQAPDWTVIRDTCAAPYQLGDVPRGVQRLFLTVDVQGDRLVCTVRGWGAEFESWLVHREELWGETNQPTVWRKLDELADREFGGMPIHAYAVDSGYRTEQALEWCRKRGTRAYATFGRDNPSRLYFQTDVEVKKKGGKKVRSGMKRWIFDSPYFKGWVHDRLGWPQDQAGAWHLPGRAEDGEFAPGTEDYCKQIVGEQRMRLPSGRVQWIRTGENHYLDCEALQALLAQLENIRGLKPIGSPPTKPNTAAAPRRGVRSSGVNVYP